MTDQPQYTVTITKKVYKKLRQLDRPLQARFFAAVALLRIQPRPSSAKSLIGFPNYTRVRIGDYRITYEIYDNELHILVLAFGHRKEVYKRLPSL